jgi:uncharacterized delta-60 repeat protein
MRNIQLFGSSLLLACLLFASAFCFAQVTEKWVVRQNGDPSSFDVPNELAVDHKGNVFVTGRSVGKGTNSDYTTIKYDDDGDKKWERRYNGPGNFVDEAVDIVVDIKGNAYVTGWSTGSGTGRDYATIKYDDDGDRKWVKRYNGPGNGIDQATAIAVDHKGNVYVTGWSIGNGTDADYTTIKYDDDGDTKWVRRYNGPGNGTDLATAIAVDDDGNVYVTGNSTGSGTGFDYATIKYDDDGDLKWVNRYNGPVNDLDRANALAIDALGNVYVTGLISTIVDEDGNPSDAATIKYNTSGVQQWVAIYDPSAFNNATVIAVDGSGSVVIAGVSGSPDESFAREHFTIKYNAGGMQLWTATGPPQNGEEVQVTDLALDAAGNVYITGGLRSQIADVSDFNTIKYNADGVQQWMVLFDGSAFLIDFARAIGLDKYGNVYVTGSNGDFLTIKYKGNGEEKWVQKYNGPGGGGPDQANAIAVDEDGNVHVTGGITKINTGVDYTTYKYDKDGDREWKKTYNGSGTGFDQASDVALDSKGNVYVTGKSAGSGGFDDYATIKYDANGNTKWVRRYNGPGNGSDEARSIAVDEKGNVYVTGGSVGSGTGFDYATIKYDGNGNIKWVKRYNNIGDYLAADIAIDKEGNVYVTGGSEGGDYLTIKYDANGNELWVASYNGPANSSDIAKALAVDAIGNVYVTGRSVGSGTSYDYATIKYNATGVQQWAARYNGPGNSTDGANALALDALGNVYVTGLSVGSETFADYATIKYDANGNQLWEARYSGPGNSFDGANALVVEASGNVYVTGSGIEDYVTIKYNAAGVQQWLARYNGPGNGLDVATAIALDDNGHVYVTGRSVGNGSDFDYATLKYEQTPVLTRSSTYSEQNNPVVAEREAVKLNAKAFPNAFTQFTNLQWSGSDKPVSITITDFMGRLVEKRANLPASGTLKTGNHFRPGIYYAVIVQGSEKVVVRLIKN